MKKITDAKGLQKEGFSEAIIDRFFKPFLGGIFFNRELTVTSRLFEFVMRCLATGSNCLPAQGIGAVSEQLASGLPEDSIHLGNTDRLTKMKHSLFLHPKLEVPSIHALTFQ